MLIPEIEVAPRIDIDIREFAIEIEGDYLNIQRFFGELQNYKLLYSIKEIKYANVFTGYQFQCRHEFKTRWSTGLCDIKIASTKEMR